MVYPHKLVDIGGSWFQPWFILTNCWAVVPFDGNCNHTTLRFSTSTCHMASVSCGNLSSAPRFQCRAMSCKDLVMQGIPNTQSTGMCKVLVKYKDIEYNDCTGPGHAGGTSNDFLPEVARNGVRSHVSLGLDPFNERTQ